jgi:plasmid maintenance system antidote protein VapI
LKKEVIEKALKTKKNALKQVAELCDTETNINIDYEMKLIKVYSNKATVWNRMERKHFDFTKEDFLDGKTYSRFYEFPTSRMSDFLRADIFRYD